MLVLVTGASAGFGEATCRLLVQKGHKVIGAARRLERLQALQQELGDAFLPISMDVSDLSGIDSALQNLPAEWQNIDVLVNNAGLALGLEPADKADFAEDIDSIQLENAKILKLEPDNQFQTKYFLERQDKTTNYLIYAPFAKPADIDNHLADTVYYSRQFFADRVSLLCADLNIPEKYKEHLSRFSKF